MSSFSRRSLLGGVGLGAAATGLAACSKDGKGASPAASDAAQIGFLGRHQAGIATPSQDRLAFAAFDVTSSRRADLISLLQTWTAAARQMTKGDQVTGPNSDQVPPSDTGEAVGLPPSRLTITIGFGPSLFDHRFGLADRRPEALKDLPPLPGEDLDRARCGGDIGIQACADDPQVAFHAIRNLNRLGFGTTTMRWSQLGFGRTSTTSRSQDTPRNLMGFKDGTRNIKAEDTGTMKKWVWVGDETDQPWMQGGTYLVARRIQMHIEAWDRD
ncbi:MAG TPA: Dyp-type peroxidase, partial [Mycobacteriales bacterium]|nr:Dyp-type peroxidase [Mycobacteriales bacterium]